MARSTWARFHASVSRSRSASRAANGSSPAWRRKRRGQGRGHGRRRGPRNLEHDDRLGQTLQLDLADEHEAELGATAGEAAHEVVAENLAAVGRVAQTGRGDDGRAVTVAVLPRHVARADADAHVDAVVVARLAIGAVEGTLDLVRRVHGLGRGAERGEDAVAEPLDHRAAVLGHRGAEHLVVPAAQAVGLDVAEPRPQLGAPDDVGVQDRCSPRAGLDHRTRLRGC